GSGQDAAGVRLDQERPHPWRGETLAGQGLPGGSQVVALEDAAAGEVAGVDGVAVRMEGQPRDVAAWQAAVAEAEALPQVGGTQQSPWTVGEEHLATRRQ